MKSLTNNYSASPISYSTSFHTPIEICCTYNVTIDSTSTIITKPQQYSLNARIKQLLNEFENLKDDWDEDNAKAPYKSCISNAGFLTDLFNNHGQRIYHAAPGPNGEIMLDVRNNEKDKAVEFIFYNDRAICVRFSPKGPEQEVFDDNKLPEIMNWLNYEVNE